jgi:hypothetical protein
MPSTSSTITPFGARGPVKRRLIRSTVMQPSQPCPIVSNCRAAQSRAAPIPRLGSVVVDRVWRVPKPTSVSTSAFSRAGEGVAAADAAAASRSGRIIAPDWRRGECEASGGFPEG